jgi:acetylornithine deacetylase
MAKEHLHAPRQNALFDPSCSTIHVGVIHGGTARNIIPKECRFLWEIRMLPEEDGNTIFRRFETFAQEREREIKKRFPNASIVTRHTSQNPPLRHALSPEQETLLLTASNSNRFHTLPFMTEAGMLQTADIPCVICGPGSIEQAHKPDEFVSIGQLEQGFSFLQELARRYCGGA